MVFGTKYFRANLVLAARLEIMIKMRWNLGYVYKPTQHKYHFKILLIVDFKSL